MRSRSVHCINIYRASHTIVQTTAAFEATKTAPHRNLLRWHAIQIEPYSSMWNHSRSNVLSSVRSIVRMCPPVSLSRETMGHTTGALCDTSGASIRCSTGFTEGIYVPSNRFCKKAGESSSTVHAWRQPICQENHTLSAKNSLLTGESRRFSRTADGRRHWTDHLGQS